MLMGEKAKDNAEWLMETVRDLLETGALVVDELIDTINPSEAECLRARRKFWECNAKIAAGLAGFAERRARDLQSPPAPQRHADRIVVDDGE
jgi:hypothetical protein